MIIMRMEWIIMNKKIIIGLIIGIIIGTGIGLMININHINSIPEVNPTYDFNFAREPVTSWNDSLKEYHLIQDVTTRDNIDYKDITFKIEFSKGNKLLNTSYIDVKNTENGKCKLDFTAKLPEEPNTMTFEVSRATKI